MIAVVVDNDRAAAEVDALTDGRVTDIGQVRNLGAVADGGLLQLYEVADAAAVTDHALRADIGKRTDRGIAADGGFINLRIVYRGACADLGFFEDGVRADDRARADLAAGTDVTAGQNGRARSNISVRRNVGAGQIEDLHALFNQAVVDTLHHLDLRHKGGSAVADDVNLVGDGNALLRTGCNSRRNQAVERISAARKCLFQHIPGEHGGIAASVSRQRLTFRVKALLLGRQYADAVTGVQVRLGQMEQRVLLCQCKRSRQHQNVLALRQRSQRGKTICGIKRDILCAGNGRLPVVVRKEACLHRIRQRIPHCIARSTEQHRTRKRRNAAFVKQAANHDGIYFIHRRNPFVSQGSYDQIFRYSFIIQQYAANCIIIFR